jgi:hypothetical protein
MAKTQALVAVNPEGFLVGVQAEEGQQLATLQPVLTQVFISPNPDDGEVFPVGRIQLASGEWADRLALAKSSLELIAQGLGVTWDTTQTGPKQLTRDYVYYQAVGSYRNPDGSMTPLIGSKEMDMEAIEMEIELNQLKKVARDKLVEKKGKSYNQLSQGEKASLEKRARGMFREDLSDKEQRQLDQAIRAELVQLRQHKLPRAETGAKNRAIRSLGIKSTYSVEELSQPFCLVKWQLNPSRQEVEEMSLKLWGPDDKPQIAPRAAEVDSDGLEDSATMEPDQGPIAEGSPESASQAPESDHQLTEQAEKAGMWDLSMEVLNFILKAEAAGQLATEDADRFRGFLGTCDSLGAMQQLQAEVEAHLEEFPPSPQEEPPAEEGDDLPF